MRYFEKISKEQFLLDNCGNEEDYVNYNLPIRKTKNSAGYDFEVLNDFEIKPNQVLKIPTGIKVKLENDEFLMLIIRSSCGFKHNIRLTNQVGIVDSDYYNNKNNEGHIWISIQNHGDKLKTFKKGEMILQGIIMKYQIVSNEKIINVERIGGIGSTSM